MQLVAYGAQDVYLSGNPQITFFKVVYRRHTNFSVEPIQQTWNGAGDFGRTVTCNINRNGDLITNMYVVVELNDTTTFMKNNPSTPSWGFVKRLGHALVSDCKIEIGGSNIDEHYSDWLNIWYELTHKTGQERGYAKMIGDVDELTTINASGNKYYKMYIPLIFWFNRNNGLALPLIALQYHDVRVTLIYRDLLSCINYSGTKAPNLSSVMGDNYLLIDYVYLDAEERKRFAQASHEYLIEQLQFTGSESLTFVSNKIRLNFNHPCKYLVWAPHLDRYNARSQWVSYATNNDWASAKDLFAKLLYISTRLDLDVSGSSLLTTPSTSWTISVNQGSSTAAGDLFDPPSAVTSTTGPISDLLNKIEVKLVRQNASTGTTGTAILSQGFSTRESLLQDLLSNCIVLTNNLTIGDISKKYNELTPLLPSASTASTTFTSPAEVLGLGLINAVDYTNYGNFIDGSDNPVYNGKLQLNGHDCFQARDGYYFNYVQPFQHFSNTPADGINVYSFALKAEDHQPSGTCNFSRIDNATLQVDLGLHNANYKDYATEFLGSNSSSVLNIFTVNYNVLRIMSGMGGTAYSN